MGRAQTGPRGRSALRSGKRGPWQRGLGRRGVEADVQQPPAGLYDTDYFMSRACDGLSEYLSGGLSPVRRKELERLGVAPSQRVLDLGCGRGESSRELARHGASVVSIDYSADAVHLTRSLLGADALVVRADAAEIPLRDGAVDRVLLGDVIEHLPFDRGVRALREVHRVMAPGGRALIHTSPNTWFIRFVKPPLSLAVRLLKWHDAQHRFAEYDRLRLAMHPNELSPLALPRLLRAAGVRGRSWVDRDVLRSGASEWTAALGRSRAFRVVALVAGSWPLRLLLGNDLYAVFTKD